MASSASNTCIQLRYLIGLNQSVSENISFTEEDTLVYIAGHSIVLYSRAEKRQRFLQAPEITESITAYTSGSGKRLCAIAERGEKPQVHIFDLRTFRRKKSFAATESLSREFVSIQFSQDDQYILTLSGAPHWMLTVWNWAKAKIVAQTQVSNGNTMYRCSMSPIDPSVCVVIGKDVIKFYRFAEKDMRPLREHNIDGHNFISHCWMRKPDDHVLAGTECGKLLLFRTGEYVCHVNCAPGPEYPIWSLLSTPDGFVLGTGPGTLLFYHYNSDITDQALFDNQFSLVNSVSFELSKGYVTHMGLSPSEEIIAMTTSDGQLLTSPVLSMHHIETKDIKYAISSFHEPKSIVGMDLATKKPLIATCAKDNTLRLWNIQTHELELLKQFGEEMFSLALHPNGLHIAIAFTDKLRIYHILVDDLRICMEVSIKGCRECRFGKGGHVLAAANGNSISVYDFHSGDKIIDLRGHNSKVRSLHWLESGCHLLSCGQDGAVYLWELDGGKRIGEYIQKGTMYTSATTTLQSIFAVGSDRAIRELAYPDLAPMKVADAGLLLTNIAVSAVKSAIFAGTAEYGKPGYVRVYSYPLKTEFDEYPVTCSQITRMKMTQDENFLISTDDSGIIAITEIRDKQDRYSRVSTTGFPDLLTVDSWSDEVLVTWSELEDLTTTTMELQAKVDELKLHNEYQLKLKEMNYAEKIKEVTDKFVQELEQAKTKLELLREERTDLELEFLEKLKQMSEKHQNDVQEMETMYQNQIMELVDGYHKLTRDRDAQLERLEDQRNQLIAAHEKYAEELTLDFEQKLDENKQIRIKYEDEKTELHQELTEIQTQLEDDVDTEIENLRRIYEEKVTTKRENTLKYKGENGIMKKKFAVITKELEERKEEMVLLHAKEKELHEQIKMLEREVSAHKKEIKSRDISIGEKEKRIYELKKKNQELDKFKFVLDFKIRELKQQIEPRQQEILGMREQIKKMDEELEKYHKSNASLDEMIGVMRKKIEDLHKETKETRGSAKVQESLISNFRADVQSVIAHILSPPDLKESVKKLMEDHGVQGTIRPRIDPDVEGEYNRHKMFLQNSIQQLQKTLQESTNSHIQSNHTLMEQNLTLIEEINKQRDKNKIMKSNVQADIGRLRRLLQTYEMSQEQKSKEPQYLDMKATPEYSNNNASNLGIDDVDPSHLLDKNRLRIQALRSALNELQNTNVKKNIIALPPVDMPRAPDIEPAFQTQVHMTFNINNHSFKLIITTSYTTLGTFSSPFSSP